MTGQCFQEKEHVLKHGEAIDQIRSDQIRSDQIRSQTYAYEAQTLHHLLPITFVFLFCDKEPFLMTLESTDIIILLCNYCYALIVSCFKIFHQFFNQ